MLWWIPERGPGCPEASYFQTKMEPERSIPLPLFPAEGLDQTLECLGFIYALTSINVHRVLVLLFRKVKSMRFADYSDPLEIDY